MGRGDGNAKVAHCGKLVDANLFTASCQRSSEARGQDESDKYDADNVIEVIAETPGPLRPNHT